MDYMERLQGSCSKRSVNQSSSLLTFLYIDLSVWMPLHPSLLYYLLPAVVGIITPVLAGVCHLLLDLHGHGADNTNPSFAPQPGQALPLHTLHQHPCLCPHCLHHLHALVHQVII